MSESDARRERAALRRATWCSVLNPTENRPPAAATPEGRILAMIELPLHAHVASGRELPTYTRSEMPGRVLRAHEDDDASS